MRSIAHRLSRLATLATACGLVVLGLVGCQNPLDTKSAQQALIDSAAARTPQLSAPDILEEGTLTVGLATGDGAPMVITDGAGYTGIDADVAAALATELGLKVSYVPLSASAGSALVSVDVVMGVSTEDAEGLVVVSDYMESAVGFFTAGDSPYVATMDELAGKTVGVQTGSASEQMLSKSNLEMSVSGYENIDAAMAGLAAGEVDYVLCPAYAGAYLANQMGGICFCGTLNVPVTEGVGVSSQSPNLADKVQVAMDTIRDNGVVGLILGKWLGDFPRLTADSQIEGVVVEATAKDSSKPADSGVQSNHQTGNGSQAGGNAVTSLDGSSDGGSGVARFT